MQISKHLFSDGDVSSVQRGLPDTAKGAVDEMSDDELLDGTIDEVVDRIVANFTAEVPTLDTGNVVPSQREIDLDVSRDPRRLVLDRSRPVYVKATEISVRVPFTGHGDMFRCRPSRYDFNPPRADIEDDTIVIRIVCTDHDEKACRKEYDQTLHSIETYLSRLRDDLSGVSNDVRRAVYARVQQRREKREKDRQLLDRMGF